MTSVSRHERINGQLVDLKMPGALEALDEVLRGVDSGSLTGSEAIEKLLGAQISLRNNRRLEAAMRSSRLPAVKTLEDFDFTFQPSPRREQIDSLHELDFVRRKENVVFLGPPGVGKTHLAISLAIRAAQHGRRVYYGSLRDLVESLEAAERKGEPSVVFCNAQDARATRPMASSAPSVCTPMALRNGVRFSPMPYSSGERDGPDSTGSGLPGFLSAPVFRLCLVAGTE